MLYRGYRYKNKVGSLSNAPERLRRAADRYKSNPRPDTTLKAGTTLADLRLDMGHRDATMLRTRYLNMAGLTRQLADAYRASPPANILHTPPGCQQKFNLQH